MDDYGVNNHFAKNLEWNVMREKIYLYTVI